MSGQDQLSPQASDEDELGWEARYGRPAAIAAFAAGILLLAGTFALQSIFEDRPRVEPLPDFLLSAHDSPGVLIISAVLQAASALFLIPVFYYLFRAIRHRTPQLPRWFVYLVVLGPVFYALSQVIGAIDRVDVADEFAKRSSHVGNACPAIFGKAGDDCAHDLLSDNVSPILVGLSLAGSVATAFLFVMLPLRARRAGLMSQFMAILGVIAGALMVLRLMPLVPEIVQAFWLGALGAIFLGMWPGGRGPAWETSEPVPWPSAAQRRGLSPPEAPSENGGSASSAEAAAPPEPEEAPQRPSSRKRRRKKR